MLTAGTYWLAVASLDSTTEGQRIAYDASGSDRYDTAAGDWFVDWGFQHPYHEQQRVLDPGEHDPMIGRGT